MDVMTKLQEHLGGRKSSWYNFGIRIRCGFELEILIGIQLDTYTFRSLLILVYVYKAFNFTRWIHNSDNNTICEFQHSPLKQEHIKIHKLQVEISSRLKTTLWCVKRFLTLLIAYLSSHWQIDPNYFQMSNWLLTMM